MRLWIKCTDFCYLSLQTIHYHHYQKMDLKIHFDKKSSYFIESKSNFSCLPPSWAPYSRYSLFAMSVIMFSWLVKWKSTPSDSSSRIVLVVSVGVRLCLCLFVWVFICILLMVCAGFKVHLGIDNYKCLHIIFSFSLFSSSSTLKCYHHHNYYTHYNHHHFLQHHHHP